MPLHEPHASASVTGASMAEATPASRSGGRRSRRLGRQTRQELVGVELVPRALLGRQFPPAQPEDGQPLLGPLATAELPHPGLWPPDGGMPPIRCRRCAAGRASGRRLSKPPPLAQPRVAPTKAIRSTSGRPGATAGSRPPKAAGDHAVGTRHTGRRGWTRGSESGGGMLCRRSRQALVHPASAFGMAKVCSRASGWNLSGSQSARHRTGR